MSKWIEPLHLLPFLDEETRRSFCVEHGLVSEKAKSVKEIFAYKHNCIELPCQLVGYEPPITAVIEFESGQQHCIHPAFLKEMQGSKGVKKEKKVPRKLDLPLDKIFLSAVVADFSTKPNPFSEHDDEIVIYSHVCILGEKELEIGEAWSSFSKSLQKESLQVGDRIQFQAKVVNKKLNKETPVKINNPSQITKLS